MIFSWIWDNQYNYLPSHIQRSLGIIVQYQEQCEDSDDQTVSNNAKKGIVPNESQWSMLKHVQELFLLLHILYYCTGWQIGWGK